MKKQLIAVCALAAASFAAAGAPSRTVKACVMQPPYALDVADDTVCRRAEPLLVDMGVKLDGVCSDMTRNVKAARDPEYAKVYDVVLQANEAAIAAARPGITAGALDAVARRIIRKAGYGKAFGHSLGHGVG